mmetsp:Transcript_55058/g.141752  ORF Transcript_55058/g.141752 Transcript_55058/m.141752 type:complete len:383 (-) Transcript_55058:64-1212(-)
MRFLAPLLAAAAATASDDAHCDGPLSMADEVRALRPHLSVANFTVSADDPGNAAAIVSRFGVLVVRGLLSRHATRIRNASDASFGRSLELMHAGHLTPVTNDDHTIGWVTPDQTLFIPAPDGHVRDKQAMVLALDYFSEASMLAAATDARALDLLERFTGWRNIELFGKGQCFYKEGIPSARSLGGVHAELMGPKAVRDEHVGRTAGAPGGNPKYLHQDSAYFMFDQAGAVAAFTYATDTSAERDNGPLCVVPGSHRLGHVEHVDTPSHLGVREAEWSFEDALRIDGAAGDTIFFHIHTLHGSTPNRSPKARPVFINRYLEANDFQTYFATDARMRARAQAEYQASASQGVLPPKDRGIMVRGRREWQTGGPAWRTDARVHH